MKNICTLLIYMVGLLFLFPKQSTSQNLVLNPGFEVQDTCPLTSEILLAQPWSSPTLGSPDLFNDTCSSQQGNQRTGIGSSGVFCYTAFSNNREYIQAPLTSSLIAGQTYCVTFYVRLASFRYSVNRMGAYFSIGAVSQANTGVLNFSPQVENDSANMLSTSGWIEVTDTFVAAGNEDYIIIGNFYNDANTDTFVAHPADPDKISYYYIDDISVEACATSAIDEVEADRSISIYPSPSTAVVNFKLKRNLIVSSATVLDLFGRTIDRIDVPVKGDELSINFGTLPEGIYIVSLKTDLGIINKRVVIAR